MKFHYNYSLGDDSENMYKNTHSRIDINQIRPHDTIHPPFWRLAGTTEANRSSWN